MREALAITTRQGLEKLWSEHRACHEQLWAGLSELGEQVNRGILLSPNASSNSAGALLSSQERAVPVSLIDAFVSIPLQVSSHMFRTRMSASSLSTPSRCAQLHGVMQSFEAAALQAAMLIAAFLSH